MQLALRGVVAFVLASVASSAAVRGGEDSVYQEIAGRWLERHDAAQATDWRALVQQHFAHLSLGAFEVHLPVESFADTGALNSAREALAGLVALQQAWHAWAAGEAPAARKPDALDRWLERWNQKTFGKQVAGGADLAELGLPDEVKAALDAFEQDMRHGGLGLQRALEGVSLVVFPRRGDFVEFTCVAGLLDAGLRPSAFADGISTWLEYSPYEVRFLTLEYGNESPRIDYRQGTSVGDRNPVALRELAAQAGTRALLSNLYGTTLDPALQSGLANALVIELYGELDTRIDGDVRSRSSQGRSVFIPGGNPDGGILPPTSAENRWRGTKGKDHFLGILGQVQKQTGKKEKARAEKLASFELVSDAGPKQVVRAPFLGSGGTKPDAAVWPDYLELVRCYGVAFLHWMRAEAAGADSPVQFGRFVRGLEGLAKPEDLPNLFLEVYRQPLSATSAAGLFEEPTLEGRFLAWLAK